MKKATVTILCATALLGTAAYANDHNHDAAVGVTAGTDMVHAVETETTTELKTVDAAGVRKMMDGNMQVVLIDSRSDGEFAQAHIPTAVSLRASEADEKRLAALIPTKETPVIFYCGSPECPASGKTAYKAAQAGYVNIYKYTEGMKDWQAKGLPVVGAAAGTNLDVQ